MAEKLRGKRIAVLATDGVEQVELTEPVKALKSVGAEVDVVAPKSGTIQGFKHHDKADKIPVDATLDKTDSSRYAALVLPGGVINPDALRLEPRVRSFTVVGSNALALPLSAIYRPSTAPPIVPMAPE